MSYPASLRQQAKWIREALDPDTEPTQRIDLDDVDTEELDAAADYIDTLVEALEFFADGGNWIRDSKLDPNSGNFRAVQIAQDALDGILVMQTSSIGTR